MKDEFLANLIMEVCFGVSINPHPQTGGGVPLNTQNKQSSMLHGSSEYQVKFGIIEHGVLLDGLEL
jgi:hypothetical protein